MNALDFRLKQMKNVASLSVRRATTAGLLLQHRNRDAQTPTMAFLAAAPRGREDASSRQREAALEGADYRLTAPRLSAFGGLVTRTTELQGARFVEKNY